MISNNLLDDISKIEKTVDGEEVVYFSDVTRFDTSYKDGYSISTGYEWETVNDLRYGKYRKYYRDCLKEESFYSNGKKNGKSFVYPYPCYKDYVKYISNETLNSSTSTFLNTVIR